MLWVGGRGVGVKRSASAVKVIKEGVERNAKNPALAVKEAQKTVEEGWERKLEEGVECSTPRHFRWQGYL